MPQHSAKDRLFARLLDDEHFYRRQIPYPDGGLMAVWAYTDFLRREVKRHPAYLLALKQIEAAHGR